MTKLVRKDGTINAKNMFDLICEISDKLKTGQTTREELAAETTSKAQELNKLRDEIRNIGA